MAAICPRSLHDHFCRRARAHNNTRFRFRRFVRSRLSALQLNQSFFQIRVFKQGYRQPLQINAPRPSYRSTSRPPSTEPVASADGFDSSLPRLMFQIALMSNTRHLTGQLRSLRALVILFIFFAHVCHCISKFIFPQ